MDERRVADYFIVAGLPENPLPLEEYANEAVIKPTYKQDPITDISVINKTLGEKVPKGFTCLDRTVDGFPADLNHGSLRCAEMYLCYRRSREKTPLTDVGVLYEGKERLMAECEVVHTTPFGSPANVNNSSNGRTYITYRRAKDTAASDTLAVVDICVILTNKGEIPPHAYHRIEKNLNRGMVGSDVYLCYKKAMTKMDVLAYQPSCLDRYPREDYLSFPLPESVPLFCLPMGASIECWSAKAQHPLPVFSTFVLTGSDGEQLYGAAVTFYEEFPEERLTDLQKRHLGLKNKHIREQYRILKTVHAHKSICLLSHWPFFDAFRKFLTYLYRISITGPHLVPLERHISHFMYDVPYPSPRRPRILVQLNHEALCLSMPEDSPLPQSGASYITMLKNLGPENCMNLLLHVLLEQKILLHSLRPAVLTGVAESVANMLFPLHWQCAYIPLCPLGLSYVLSAPIPFIVGVDTRYFDLYDPPPEVICVDLDTIAIFLPDDKKNTSYKQFPKKAARVLYNTLHRLFDELCAQRAHTHSIDEISLEMAPIDHDFKRKRKETLMELQIQEAFLRFMACLLKGYKQFLKPITRAPTQSTTDATSLFDMQGFLKSRDKANIKFYNQLVKTQTFIRFIEERSFVSDKDASLAFFDECTEKVDETKEEPKLIEIDDSQNSERTVFILPPEPVGLPEGVKYSYNGFPELKHELFMKKNVSELSLPSKGPVCPNSPISRRTKQEVRTAQKNALQNSTDPMLWAKCLLSHCYSLWFIHLPAYVTASPSKNKALKAAYDVLQKMKLAKLQPPDEVCYRVMLQLCGQYNMPVLAVKVHSQMKMAGVHPNAITYGYYNKAVFEGTWPSSRSRGAVLWKKVRNVIIGVAQFRRAIRRRSVSICSNSGSDYDQISRTSIDSFLEDTVDKQHSIIKSDIVVSDTAGVSSEAPTATSIISEESASSGIVSDRGYNSMTYDEAKTIVQGVSEMTIHEDKELGKVKKDNKSSLRFTLPRKHNSVRTSGKKDLEFPASDADPTAFRSRVGSIVRKSLGSIGSIGSHETLKGSLMSLSSTGLIMVNENARPNEFQRQLSFENNNGKRKRHKSAGDYNKPRSHSVSENWRPRHVSGEDRLLLKFSELEGKHSDDDIFEVELDKPEDSGLSDEARTSDDTKDSGVVLDECRVQVSDNSYTPTSSARPMSIPIDMKSSSMSNSVSAPETLDPSPILHSIGTPVTTNDPLGLFMDNTQNIPPSDSRSKLSSETNVTFTQCVSPPYEISTLPESSDQFDFNKTISSSGITAHECNIGEETTRTRSNSENKHVFSLGSAQSLDAVSVTSTGSQPLSPVGKIGKRLMDIGRTNSSPGSLDDTEKPGRGFWPVKGYLQSLSSSLKKSNDSLDEKQESSQATTPDSRGQRKVGSFRKHNERLSGALKSGFGALANKFSEIKQTMSTPTKMGSNSSLSHTGDNDSLHSEDGHHRGALDVPPRKTGMGSDRDLRRGDAHDESKDTATALPVGSFLPSSSFMEQYIPLKEFGEQKSVHFASLAPSLNDIAIETEISSCCRCTRCKSLLYDEEIMSGWLADDSNLNTTCVFCQTKIVPRLQIYVKDWRDHHSNTDIDDMDMNDLVDKVEEHHMQTRDHDRDSVSETSTNDPWVLQDNSSLGSVENNNFFFPGEDSLDGDGHASPVQSHRSARKDAHLAEAALCSSPSGTSGSSEFNVTSRRRCTSECLTSATDMMFGTSFDSMDNFQNQFIRSPLNISIEEENELPTRPSDLPEMKKDFMERGTTSIDPITVPYLSPLVLRKELENILNSEGDMSISVDVFLDEHPIIFWNLVWYFKRIEVPSHMPGLLLTAKSTNAKPVKSTAVYTSQHVLIRPLWDNIRIHDEVGLPMYKLWNEGHSSHTVDALITEQQPFNRATLHQIITNVQCNDVLSPIKMIGNCRRRHRLRRPKYRSLYRDMLFLAFTACGRENIDHDAFDREYRQAFNRLLPMEVKRLQRNDRPRKTKVIWCRKVFGELEV